MRAFNHHNAVTHAPIIQMRSVSGDFCDVLAATTGGFGVTGNCTVGGDNGQDPATWCVGCTISTWYDQAGGGVFNATNPVVAMQPSLAFNVLGVGTLPAAWFNPSGAPPSIAQQHLSSATGLTIPQPNSVDFVAESLHVGGSYVNQGITSNGSAAFIVQVNPLVAPTELGAFAGISVGNGMTAAPGIVLKGAVIFNDGASKIAQNNVIASGINTGTNGGGSNITIGGQPTTFFFDGFIAEVGYCNSAQSDADITASFNNQTAFGY